MVRLPAVVPGATVLLLLFSGRTISADKTTLSMRRRSREGGALGLKRPLQASGGLPDEAVQGAFTQIYNSHTWSEAGGGSGSGSTKEMTTAAITILRLVANTYGLRSLIDTPCGAFVWQPLLLQLLEDDFPDFKYLGLDVVESVIQGNIESSASRPNWKFQVKDLSSERIPTGYDLLLSRDALQHLPCVTAVNMLENIAGSRPRFLLLGSYNETGNVNIGLGDYFSINLRVAPFNMEEGLVRTFQEHNAMINPGEVEKEMLLFTGEYMQTLDFATMRSGCALLPDKYA